MYSDWPLEVELYGVRHGDDTDQRATSVTQAFLKMKKFDIAELQKAFDGGSRVELSS